MSIHNWVRIIILYSHFILQTVIFIYFISQALIDITTIILLFEINKCIIVSCLSIVEHNILISDFLHMRIPDWSNWL